MMLRDEGAKGLEMTGMTSPEAGDARLEKALGDFRASIHAWSEARMRTFSPAVVLAPHVVAWRRTVAWAIGVVLAVGAASGAVYERRLRSPAQSRRRDAIPSASAAPMKRAGLEVPSSYFHDSRPGRTSTACMSLGWRGSAGATGGQRACSARPADTGVDEQRGHTLAMEVEDAKIALADTRQAASPWNGSRRAQRRINRPDLVSHTRQLAKQNLPDFLCIANLKRANAGKIFHQQLPQKFQSPLSFSI